MSHVPSKLQQFCPSTVSLFLSQHFLRSNLFHRILKHFGVFFEFVKESDAVWFLDLLMVEILFGVSVIVVVEEMLAA